MLDALKLNLCLWIMVSARILAGPVTLEFGPGFPKPNLPADNPLTTEGIELGRHLFYDTALSRRNVLSCSNCHEQHSAFSDNWRFSIGFDGETTRRNSMALFNLAFDRGFFWDGRAPSLRAQALKPIQDPKEMGERLDRVVQKIQTRRGYPECFKAVFGDSKVTSDRIGLAIEQFMLSIISNDAKYDKVQRGEEMFTPQEQRGHDLFFARSEQGKPGSGANCFLCHDAPLFTNNQFTNNGCGPDAKDRGLAETTKQARDAGKFKTPSLRNVEVTYRYMHDTRFRSLEEVLAYYNEGVPDIPELDPHMAAFKDGLGLSEAQISDIIAFLHTLTDRTFLQNAAYGDPKH